MIGLWLPLQEGTTISIYNTETGKVIGSYANARYAGMGNTMSFSPDGNYFAASLTSFLDEGKGKGILFTTSDWKTVWMCETEFTSLDEISPTNEGECYVLSYDRNMLGEFGMTMNQNLTCFNQDGTVRFTIEGMMAISSPIQVMGESIVYANGSSMCIVSRKDGSILREIHYNSSVCNVEVLEENNTVVVGLLDGSVIASIIKDKDVLNRQYMEGGDYRMRHVHHYRHKIIEEPVSSNKIYVYKNALGSKALPIVRANTTVYDVEATSDNELILVYTNDLITAYRSNGQKEMYHFKPDDTVVEIIMLEEENRFLLIERNGVEAYQLSDGRPLEQAEMNSGFYYQHENKLFTVNKESKLAAYNMRDLEQVTVYDTDALIQGYLSGDEKTIVGISADKTGFSYDIETKTRSELGWSGELLVTNEQGTKYFVADAYTNQASIYPFDGTEPEASMEIKADFIKAASFPLMAKSCLSA